MVDNALAVRGEERAVADVKRLMNLVLSLRTEVMKPDVDYGVIPGTGDKPVLLLPGMEKLMRALQLRPEYALLSSKEDFDKPLFYYRYECRMVEIDTGRVVSSAIGSANSMESKWSQRWVTEDKIPPHLDKSTLETRSSAISEFAFAVEKGETSGPYGKPAAYWQQFRDAIANGTARKTARSTKSGKQMDAWEIGGAVYRIPNPDIFDQINTIDKIAQKRALSSAIKGAANVSEYFTVDLEDRQRFDVDVIDAEVEEVSAQTIDRETGVITPLVTEPAPIKVQVHDAEDLDRVFPRDGATAPTVEFPSIIVDKVVTVLKTDGKPLYQFTDGRTPVKAFSRDPLRSAGLSEDVLNAIQGAGEHALPQLRLYYKQVKLNKVAERAELIDTLSKSA